MHERETSLEKSLQVIIADKMFFNLVEGFAPVNEKIKPLDSIF